MPGLRNEYTVPYFCGDIGWPLNGHFATLRCLVYDVSVPPASNKQKL